MSKSERLSAADMEVVASVDESEYIFFRGKDGALRPQNHHGYSNRRPCATHGPYDAGLDGRCVHCYQKIAPRTIIVIED